MMYKTHSISSFRSQCKLSLCLAMIGTFLSSTTSIAIAAEHKNHPSSSGVNSKAMGKSYSIPDAQGDAESKIIAIINGQLLTQRDVNNREQLFQLTAGIRLTPDVMQRMRPQLIKQLITERLHTQEMLRRNINIAPEQIAEAIADIEKRNGMPPNALRNQLSSDGVSMSTLIDQIRLQLGWGQVIQQELGSQNRITAQDVEQRQKALKQEVGQPEYLLNEIFVPVENARHPEQELQFTQTIIQQLRNGAPFPIVAAQFSQAQSALQGGSLGWVQKDSLDPEVATLANKMPVGAISNPIKVAGGYIIAMLSGKRTIGNEMGTLMTIRQVFLPFSSKLNPKNPTPQQISVLKQVNQMQQSLHTCQQVEEANQKAGGTRPSDPGPMQLERMNPEMGNVLQGLQPGQVSKPLVSIDGIALIMVCSKEKKNIADISASEIANQLLSQRVEQVSQQLDRDLHRQAIIEMHTNTNESAPKPATQPKRKHK
ncbi:peptidylprolyl isomerase [Commensalibacter papalotli (ex Botero et al. 2024)]|uniref:Parvulin-like PPIase n=1 Tax=Commensalibacter papalotli (ex Botero et al. 2024) TaxID=2972766 RepID=A0ABN8W6I1_9PROT|nr:peptidylprolyl isomerase [Commensalibacter papalotli (ex Botero et al. 2024)]CAI3937134.1 Peptidyl-prolyl isomerase [Commensalibacter papalotli (ex Botero et al. 2024)]CAI3938479.1 Peptidyl-prolyl isomerase [Commensalibacter papalotli (ex Botero et al. 2024)]